MSTSTSLGLASSSLSGHKYESTFFQQQEFSICGPEKETCVAKQTLRDEKCLVSCDGLYADIADDSLKQNMISLKQNVMSLKQNTIKGFDSLHV